MWTYIRKLHGKIGNAKMEGISEERSEVNFEEADKSEPLAIKAKSLLTELIGPKMRVNLVSEVFELGNNFFLLYSIESIQTYV